MIQTEDNNKKSLEIIGQQLNPIVFPSFDKNIGVPNISINLYKLLTKYKNYIDKFNKNKRWDKVKKISNDDELIYTTEKKKRKRQISISNYEPISRSYYKLTEIFCDFDLVNKGNNNDPIVTAHIAEVRIFRSTCYYEKIVMIKFGMTLKSSNNTARLDNTLNINIIIFI